MNVMKCGPTSLQEMTETITLVLVVSVQLFNHVFICTEWVCDNEKMQKTGECCKTDKVTEGHIYE